MVMAITVRAEGAIYFVNGMSGSDSQSGLSWAQAFKTPQKAIAVAKGNTAAPHEIWVTAGIYRPDEGPGGINSNDPNAFYEMVPQVALYGGFVGTEANLDDRDLVANITILSGDIDVNDAHNPATSPADIVGNNSYHVLRFVQDDPVDNPTAIVDGFTVTAGDARQIPSDIQFLDQWIWLGGGANLDGGATPCDLLTCPGPLGPSFQNCRFVGNRSRGAGGAVGGRNIGVRLVKCSFENNETDGDFALINAGGGAVGVAGETQVVGCTFVGNTSKEFGGALNISGSIAPGSQGARIVNSRFLQNTADERGGGAYVHLDAGYMVNCVFAGNTALGIEFQGAGGGLDVNRPVVNCTFVNNRAEDPNSPAAGGGAVLDPPATIENCIFRGNTAQNTNTSWNVQQVFRTEFNSTHCPQFCDIEGMPVGCGCGGACTSFDADPLFLDADGPDDVPDTYLDNDYHLFPWSPCADAGNPSDLVIPLDDLDADGDMDMAEPTPDMDPNDRVLDNADADSCPRVDVGMDEVALLQCPWDCAAGGDGVVDTVDFFRLLQDWGMPYPASRCDQVAQAGIDTADFIGLLGAWGPCPSCAPPGGGAAQAGAGAGEAGAPGSGLTLEDALLVMGFSSAEEYAAWVEQASDEEREASGLLLAALLGGSG
jgi:hypothetical protein